MGNEMFRHAYIYAQMRRGDIPDIYVQDPKYFEEYEKEIKEMFSDGVGFLPYVGIHVRRGDYVGNPFHVDLSATDYFDRAIALSSGKKFLVFSDDAAWCKEHFNDADMFQVMEGTQLEDFNMLASCETQIISNSSFSWWTAYLCPAPNKRIIAPKAEKWFHDGVARVGLPGTWEQIDYEKV